MSKCPVCVSCRVEMLCQENEVIISDRVQDDNPNQRAYWYGDMYYCPACKFEIVTDFGTAIYADPDLGPPRFVIDEEVQP